MKALSSTLPTWHTFLPRFPLARDPINTALTVAVLFLLATLWGVWPDQSSVTAWIVAALFVIRFVFFTEG